MEKYYTREITPPKTKRDGLANFVQMVINRLEADEPREALLVAVDLLDSIVCGQYDNVETGATINALHAELSAKHAGDLDRMRETAYAAGIDAARADIAARLGLAGFAPQLHSTVEAG